MTNSATFATPPLIDKTNQKWNTKNDSEKFTILQITLLQSLFDISASPSTSTILPPHLTFLSLFLNPSPWLPSSRRAVSPPSCSLCVTLHAPSANPPHAAEVGHFHPLYIDSTLEQWISFILCNYCKYNCCLLTNTTALMVVETSMGCGCK